jgi:hypothetical protein
MSNADADVDGVTSALVMAMQDHARMAMFEPC